MTNSEQETTDFATRVRGLLLRYRQTQEQLRDTRAALTAAEKKARDMELLATAAKRDYDTLRAARLMELSGGDVESVRRRVAKLARDVDKCVVLLSERQDSERQ